ncbi:ABC transporter ATP-binding protein [Aliihoeflea sp. 2WW]|uniref:ABC transporter ATP-binding protein n=1 Tax=Aliihoeflea sp. 2WW TaxID=1381123 RepID=UPI0004646CB3|nr:ABC transporter ATP-binding protein [Aliihoeflea sp. 2WW]
MLEVDSMRSAYGRIAVLHGVSFRVDRGEIVALIGSNGAGKTTILRVLSGVQPLTGGSICLDGRPLVGSPSRRVELGIAHSPEGRQVFGPLSVEDNLRLGAYRHRADMTQKLERTYSLFPALAEKRLKRASELSGGQQQMLAIGRALMAEPKFLLLDEPSLGLAPVVIDQMFETIRTLNRQGTTILLVEQNAAAALSLADRAYVVETGKIVREGAGTALRNDPAVRAAYLGL